MQHVVCRDFLRGMQTSMSNLRCTNPALSFIGIIVLLLFFWQSHAILLFPTEIRNQDKVISFIYWSGIGHPRFSISSNQNIKDYSWNNTLLSGFKWNDHITPVLAAVHWPHEIFILFYFILLLICMNGQALAYISNLLTPYEPYRCLRSSCRALLKVLKSQLVTKGSLGPSTSEPQLLF